jgi:flagellar basal-body rod protein FlgB
MMAISLDKAFGIHAQALIMRSQRAQVLAANLANADTPNYKARDVDFDGLLKEAAGTASVTRPVLITTHAGHLSSGEADGMSGELLYRVPLAPSLDGNTVDTQVEQAKFAENAVQYMASLNFLNGNIKGLMTAIRGE